MLARKLVFGVFCARLLANQLANVCVGVRIIINVG